MPVIDERQELAKKSDLLTKQDILTAGTGITIQNNVISATGTGGSTVNVTPVLTTGTRIAAMEVDGTIYTLFAPTPPSISVTQIQQSGVELARVTINGVATSIYAPENSTVLSGTSAPSSSLGEDNNLYVQYTVTSGVYTVDMTYVKLSGAWVELSAGGGTGNVDDVYVNGTSVLDSNKIAQITSYREVTQAEYDALPASKESDNVLYCIKDKATADTTVAPIIYSEEEREVGVWTDGRPLYQKSFSGTTSTSGNATSIMSASNIDSIIGVSGYINDGTNQYCIPYRDGGDYMSAYRTSSDVFTNYSNYFRGKSFILTLKYTKTTDAPGSGKYAPSGVPAVHYSENEQVVGTWVDGSTLYEKTIELSKTLSSGNNIYDVGLSDFVIRHAEGYLTSTTGQYLDMFAHLNPTGGLTYCIACWFSEGNKLYISCGSNMTGNYTGSVTVRYTKSTS